MTAISITALAGALILLAVETSMQTMNDSVEQTIALGLAQQLVDEISGKRYHAIGAGATQAALGPSAWEAQGVGRQRYDDIDDYEGFLGQGLKDPWNQPLGRENGSGGLRPANFQVPAGYFARWRQRVEVYYVGDQNFARRLPNGQTSNHRAVEVTIERVADDGAVRPLAQLRRVFAYVPTLP